MAESKPVPVRIDGRDRVVEIVAQPIREEGLPHHTYVVFRYADSRAGESADSEGKPGPRPRGRKAKPLASADADRTIHQLAEEIERLKEELRTSVEEHEGGIEELKSANEELQSANEEPKSTAEELETSREELQSINEELQTVNEEHKNKIEELARTNNDLQNLMAATDAGTLFLDRDLRVKRFTPHVGDVLNVIGSEVGRPLTHITSKLDYDRLAEDARRVLHDLTPLEKQAQAENGRAYSVSLRPHRTAEDRIEGVVVTFVDITTLKRSVEEIRRGDERYRLLVNNLPEYAIFMLDLEGWIDRETIASAVARTGMRAEPWSNGADHKIQTGFWQAHARTITTIASGIFLTGGFLAHTWITGSFTAAIGVESSGGGHDVPAIAAGFYLEAVFAAGWFVLPRAWFAVRRLSPDMNLLMTIAVVGAIAIGEWFEAGAVYFLFALSLLLESWSVGRARRAVEALMEPTPTTVCVVQGDGSSTEVASEEVSTGTRFLVRPGERLPLDGLVVSGASEVDQSPITGESRPVSKGPDSEVFAGTINGDSVLEIVSTKAAGDTTLARIIRMVSDVQSRRAPSERWVEKFARIYTPAVLALAVVVLVAPPLFAGASWSEWLYRSLVLLVISCPCALVISTPVSIVASLTASARQGVLVKGGVYMEAPARLRAVAFDKTGTLTEGRPQVLAVVPFKGHTEEELLSRAAAFEAHSDHPLARAIVRHADERGVSIGRAEETSMVAGRQGLPLATSSK